MSLVKTAFLGLSYRPLSDNEKGFYTEQNERVHKPALAVTAIGGGLLGGLALHEFNSAPLTAAGALVGAASLAGAEHLIHKRKMRRMAEGGSFILPTNPSQKVMDWKPKE